MRTTPALRIGTGTIHPTSTTTLASGVRYRFLMTSRPEYAAFTDAARVPWKRVPAIPVLFQGGQISKSPPPRDRQVPGGGRLFFLFVLCWRMDRPEGL